MILSDAPERALAVFAHPDDPEVACAGTLAAWVAAGCEAHLVIANAGDKGADDPALDPHELARVRLIEAATRPTSSDSRPWNRSPTRTASSRTRSTSATSSSR